MTGTDIHQASLPPRFVLRLGGVAGLITAITTFLLWYLPRTYDVAPGFDGVIALHAEPAYMARLWINFWHVFLALLAYGVVAAVLWQRSKFWAAFGFIAFSFWCLIEAVGVSINIWAVNETWRAGYVSADSEQQLLLKASLQTFSGIWNGLFFVILITFLLGTLAYGVALWSGKGIEKILSLLFLLAVPLTLIILADSYFGASLSRWISWSYPILQPVSRGLMGIWLIRLSLHSGN